MLKLLTTLSLLSVLTSGVISSLVQAQTEQPTTTEQPRLVMVIDDMGNDLPSGRAALKLPGPVSYAFLPHLPHTQALANEALFRDKEVLLHAPMENKSQRKLGPGALTQQLSAQQLQDTFNDALDSVPGVIGFNNHMGSLLTEKEAPMQAIMAVAAQRKLFFLDSVTSNQSVAWKTAQQYQLPVMSRDVFIDHFPKTDFIDRQFRLALDVARQRGHVVVIGHPYEETINYLRAALPTLAEQGIQQVSASAFLLQQQIRGEDSAAPDPVAGPTYYPN